jgi:hypothetical protein
MIAYRICERKGDKLLTLFHALNGSRVLPIGTWLNANIKPVWDGSRKTAKEYLSGFHVLKTEGECKKFMGNRFRAPRELVIVECEVRKLRKKEHSPFNVFLADEIKLLKVIE